MLKEVVPHEGMVTFGMVSGQSCSEMGLAFKALDEESNKNQVFLKDEIHTYILIHVKGLHILKRYFPFLIVLNQFLIASQRSAA